MMQPYSSRFPAVSRSLCSRCSLLPLLMLVDGSSTGMTVHAAKGLEFDQVWLIGLVEKACNQARGQLSTNRAINEKN
jgi:superfamily I DNA/RNA helicase